MRLGESRPQPKSFLGFLLRASRSLSLPRNKIFLLFYLLENPISRLVNPIFRFSLANSLKFLIHTDFDTSASRQDIVTTSRRNIDLLDGITDTFI